MTSDRAPRRAPTARALAAVVRALAVPASLAAFVPGAAGAQMAGLPVFQGAFLRPGLAIGVNGGGADDASTIGGALAWAVGGGRFGVAAGVGRVAATAPYRSPSVTYGTRLAFTAASPAGGRLAITPFVGVGRAHLRRGLPGGGTTDGDVVRVPAGVSVGFRRGLGARGTLAFFAAPMYAYSRPDSAGAPSHGVARVSAGAEYGIATGFGAIGVTAGLELGQSMPMEAFGPRGSAFGLGIALARGTRR